MAGSIPTSSRKVLLAAPAAPADLLRGVARYAREHKWHLITDMVVTGAWPGEWSGDGILAAMPCHPEALTSVVEKGIPCVALSGAENAGVLPAVGPDNREIGRIAADHLIERAHRSFAAVPFIDDAENQERLDAFRARVAEHGCDCTSFLPMYARAGCYSNHNWAEHRRALIAQIERLPRPSAIFAFNDCVAAEIVDACREAGLLVPKDLAVLGVGDAIVCTTSAVPISSIDTDLDEIGYRAAAVLEAAMNGVDVPAGVIRVPPKGVVTRMSTDLSAVSDPRIARVLNYIAEHYPNPALSVGSIADAVGMSRRNLERSFREATGGSVHEHIVDVRMREASRLLKSCPTTRNSYLAALVGFSGERTFFRVFRRYFGMSPKAHGDWANRARAANRAVSLPVQRPAASVKSRRSPIEALPPTAA
ncbi:MAG TPA: DNA-binding transcriptional regulator [Opitutus sp.]|nr:DNA-binding transcriptional regulator [Opitutus sp.]